MVRLLREHWFLAAYVGILGLAWLWPDGGRAGGLLHLDAIRLACVAGIFLCAGLLLPSGQLGAALRDWRAHCRIQGVSFVAAPLLGLGLAWVAGRCGLSLAAQSGLVVLACLPTTIGSCVAHTGMAGGNQGLALVNSVLGNLAGVVVTPLLVVLCLDRHGTTPVATIIGQLMLVALLPVLAGQAARLGCAAFLDRQRSRISVVSGCLLLLIALGIFSDLAHHGLASDGLAVLAAAAVLHGLLAGLGWWIGAGRSRADRIAIAITAAQKTAALGVPLTVLLFAGDPHLALITAPVVLYHAVQQATGAIGAVLLRRWVSGGARP